MPMAGSGVLVNGVQVVGGASPDSMAPILALLCVDEEALEDKFLVSSRGWTAGPRTARSVATWSACPGSVDWDPVGMAVTRLLLERLGQLLPAPC